MRREAKQQSYIDWLKSLGCVFYAPLTQNDLTDHIGGTTGVPVNASSGNLVWNSSQNAYRLVSSTWGANPLRFPMIDLQTRWNGALSWTWVMDIRKINYATFQMIIGYIPNTANNWTYTNNNGWPLDGFGSDNVDYSSFHRYAISFEYITSTQYHLIRYIDNAIFSDDPNWWNTSTLEQKRCPEKWPNSYYNYISLCSCISSNHKTDAYVRNCFLFNTILTNQQIMSL